MQSKKTTRLIINALRQASLIWEGRRECLNNARKKVVEGTLKNGKPKEKYYWQCAKCKEWFRNENDLEVDHIVEVGSKEGKTWDEFIDRLMNDGNLSNLQALCIGCHAKKTSGGNASMKFVRKKPI